jgi:outer membrane lipoprotein carrier protein
MKRPTILALFVCGVAVSGCGPGGGETGRGLTADTAARATVPEAVAPAASPAAAEAPAAGNATEPAAREGRGVAAAPPASSVAAQDSLLALLQRASRRYSAVRSMRASFALETSNPLLRETVRSRGELYQRRPDRLLMRFTEPAGDVIVSDGRYIWVWYPSIDSAQVIRSPAGSGAGTVDLLAQFVGDPTRRFSWSAGQSETVDGHTATLFTLDPLGDEAYQQLVVWIDHDDALVRRFEVTEISGVVRRIELRNVMIDSDLPDSLFRFTPPPGARIVGAP